VRGTSRKSQARKLNLAGSVKIVGEESYSGQSGVKLLESQTETSERSGGKTRHLKFETMCKADETALKK